MWACGGIDIRESFKNFSSQGGVGLNPTMPTKLKRNNLYEYYL